VACISDQPQQGTRCETACEEGTYSCSADGTTAVCSAAPANACGGCGALTETLGASCGCGDGSWVCSGGGLACSDATANACGGCGDLAQPPGQSCGLCGTLTCSGDGAAVFCDDHPLNDCGLHNLASKPVTLGNDEHPGIV
jgi:hypothetical protein